MELFCYGIVVALLRDPMMVVEGKLQLDGIGYTLCFVGNATTAPYEHCAGLTLSDRLDESWWKVRLESAQDCWQLVKASDEASL